MHHTEKHFAWLLIFFLQVDFRNLIHRLVVAFEVGARPSGRFVEGQQVIVLVEHIEQVRICHRGTGGFRGWKSRQLSKCCAMGSKSPSQSISPTTCSANGKPSEVQSKGSETVGNPRKLQGELNEASPVVSQ